MQPFSIRRPACLLLAFSCPALAAAATQQSVQFEYALLTDAIQVLPGATLGLEWNGGQALLTAGPDGGTEPVYIPDSAIVEATAHEMLTPDGSTVGQSWSFAATSHAGYERTLIADSYFQPEARTVVFDTVNSLHHDPRSEFWYATHSTPASYSFSADVAVLCSFRQVDAYLSYVGLPLPFTYRQGVILRAETPIDIDYSDGFLLEIPLQSGFEAVRVDGYEVLASIPGQAGFDYQYIRSIEGSAYVHVWGTLPSGDNVLLLRSTRSTPSGPRQAIQHTALVPPPLPSSSNSPCVPCDSTPLAECEMTGVFPAIPPASGTECTQSGGPEIVEWMTQYTLCGSETEGSEAVVVIFRREGQATFESEISPQGSMIGAFYNDVELLPTVADACTCSSYFRCNFYAKNTWNCVRRFSHLVVIEDYISPTLSHYHDSYQIVTGVGGGYTIFGTSCIMACCE